MTSTRQSRWARERAAVEGFRSIFADLKDPRTGNARLHDLHAILVIALCTVLCGGEDCSDMALVRSGQGAVPAPVPAPGTRHPQPRHVLAGVPTARSRAVPRLLSGVHAPLCRGLAGCGGARRQDPAALL